jgi:hypothetical protein
MYTSPCYKCSDPLDPSDEKGPGGWWKARSFLDWLFDRPYVWIICDYCKGSGLMEHD